MEVGSEKVPIVQKRIIQETNKRGKIVITATQMLDSMIRNPRPTGRKRQTLQTPFWTAPDALMLSGETAAAAIQKRRSKPCTRSSRRSKPQTRDTDFLTKLTSIKNHRQGRLGDLQRRGASRGIAELRGRSQSNRCIYERRSLSSTSQ